MSGNKRAAALIVVALLCLVLSASANSDLIQPDQIKADEVKYNTCVAEYGEYAKSSTNSASLLYPCLTPVSYKGTSALYVETLVKRDAVVKAGDPIMRVSPGVDEVGITEKELTLERTRANLETGIAQRQKAIEKLEENLKKPQNTFSRRRVQLQIDRANIQLEQYIFQQEKSIADQEAALESCTRKLPWTSSSPLATA